METIRNNRVTAGIIGGAAVLILLAVLLSGGGTDEPEFDAGAFNPFSTSTPSASAAPTTPEEFPLTEVPQLNCGPVLTIEEEEEGLGLNDRPFGEGGKFEFSRNETCTIQLASDDRFFVQVTPGTPADFEPGIERLGVTGQLVEGIGDRTIWFGGPDSSDGGRAGVLSVAENTPLGLLIFRIVLGRPDLDEAAQLKVATTLALAALPRFPGVEAPPPPEPNVLSPEHAPVDQSNQSYVTNLLAREADGEWTRGEGLVATLRYIAGELEASEVLRAGMVLAEFDRGIIRAASDYSDSMPGSTDAAEIERLLALLIPRDPRANSAQALRGSDMARSLAINRSSAQEPECQSIWPDHGDPCIVSDSPVGGDESLQSKYLLWFPVLEEGEEWVGWVKGESTIGNAMFQSIEFFEGLSGKMPPVSVWLTPFQGGSYIVGEGGEGDACNVMLASGAQGLRDQDPALLQQAIAFSFASCYIIENFGDQDISSWWADGLGWYLSDVVFPDASLEIELLHVPSTLAGEELGTTILERTITNMAFFEWMDAASDVEGVLSTAATINTSGLDAVANVADLLHDFEKALSDGVIVDQGGAHEFTPGADSYILAKGDKVEAKPQPFGVVRVEVLVPSGMFACVKYDSKGEVKASYRTGSAGSGGGWGAPPGRFRAKACSS